MFQSILSNLAILLLGHLFMSTLMNYRDRLSKNIVYLSIVILFSAVIITMLYLPIQFGEYRLDLRLIPLIFLAFFRGARITLPVLAIVCTWRYFMGGDGAIPGIVYGMLLPTLFTLLASKVRVIHTNHLMKILVIVICWSISDVPIIFIIPSGWEIFQEIFLLRFGSFLGVAIIYYAFITIEHKQFDLKQELKFLAWHDPLTKLLNKNRFLEVVEEQSGQRKLKQSIAMMDIDHFKQLNDTYGHLVGDEILVQLSAILKKYESDHVIIARFGGEEFIIYQESEHVSQAEDVLNELRNEIANTDFIVEYKNLSLKVTISIGMTELEEHGSILEGIDVADKNLYKAKNSGRNCLIMNCKE